MRSEWLLGSETAPRDVRKIRAMAIAGGIAWWVVGEKRRRREAESTTALVPAIAFRPTGIDLRLRF